MSHGHYTSQLSQQGALLIGSWHERGYQAAVLVPTPRIAEVLGGRVHDMGTGPGIYGIRAAALARAENDGDGRGLEYLAYRLSR